MNRPVDRIRSALVIAALAGIGCDRAALPLVTPDSALSDTGGAHDAAPGDAPDLPDRSCLGLGGYCEPDNRASMTICRPGFRVDAYMACEPDPLAACCLPER